jgi:primosomal protein N''
MKYTIEKLADLETIKVTIDGRLNILERKEIFSQAMYDLKTNGYNRLLFDVSKSILSSDYTDDESIELSNYIKTLEVQKKTKIAFLSPTILMTQITFLAIVRAVNEDIVVRHFIDYDKAIKWLCVVIPVKYKIEKLADLEIIKVTIDGKLNYLEREEIYSQAMSELKTNGYNRLLFDVSKSILPSDYTDKESIDISKYMKTFAIQKNTKLAFLSTHLVLTQIAFLGIAKAINEGLDMMHFTNYDKAIKWLCQ